MDTPNDYKLLDVGGGGRLERFGSHITDRPNGGALSDRHDPGAWASADLRFDRDRGWSGPGLDAANTDWTMQIGGLTMGLRPTSAGQVGVFPEHESNLAWLVHMVTERSSGGGTTEILNLFAHTGLATLTMAGRGARVTHVDAARPSVAWARANARRSGLDDRPIRWIVDDAHAYSLRERRRGRRYSGIVMDPPTYGHGSRGDPAWRLETDLPELLRVLSSLLAPGGFILLTAHAEDHGAERLADLLGDAFGAEETPRVEAGELARRSASGAVLRLGAYARIAGGAA